jgi:hypothetical protein
MEKKTQRTIIFSFKQPAITMTLWKQRQNSSIWLAKLFMGFIASPKTMITRCRTAHSISFPFPT